jgi:hypothetical protein
MLLLHKHANLHSCFLHAEIRAHLLHEHPTTHEPGLLFKLQALFASGITMPDGRVIPVRLREGYDYVALCAVMGTKGPLATFFCPFCDINKNDKTKVLDDAPLLPGDTIHVLAVRHMLPHETLKVCYHRGRLCFTLSADTTAVMLLFFFSNFCHSIGSCVSCPTL